MRIRACLQSLTLIVNMFVFLILETHLYTTDFIIQFVVMKI